MKSEIFVDNIKCGGCASTIIKKVEAVDRVSNVVVDIEKGKITFDHEAVDQKEIVVSTLKKWGYPEAGTGNKIDNAKSFVSCMIGRIDN